MVEKTSLVILALAGSAGLVQVLLSFQEREARSIAGIVQDEDGPVGGAIVRVQATNNRTTTSGDGSFVLGGLSRQGQLTVTAWADGYFVGWTRAYPGASDIYITLKRYYTGDNPDYDWVSTEGAEGSKSCGHCMPGVYAEWQADAHSRSAVNPRFLTMYTGADMDGNRSPLTRYGSNRDYGRFPLPPNPSEPYYGPGYLLDFPNTAGNCAACHAPAAAAKPGQAYAVRVDKVSGIATEGVFCELCHKVGGVTIEAETGLLYGNMPGVLSMRLHRPEKGQELFFGPFDDVTRRVSYLLLQKRSAFCAPCHFGRFWGVQVYNSYGEWLASPYSDPEKGKTCQDCHMPKTENATFALPEKGGMSRPVGCILSHRMPGADDVGLLQDTASLNMTAQRVGDRIKVDVLVTNDKAGHHIPTDHPARNILLVVSATDDQGKELRCLSGQLIPDWGGKGNAPNDYAGRPGKGYAKILEELWTEISPTAAYWRQIVLREDTRIPALATDVTHYEFDAPNDSGPITIAAKLIFRRAFKELARQKKWNITDILMEERRIVVQ
jgi:nitrate/TMAO reductase-like tetraheme cytochrome c subunit